ncbi:MAG: membrane protein insertion efficiency factor YidD [Phycisphaerales bacterium]
MDDEGANQGGGAHRLGVWARIGNVPFLAVIYVYRVTLSPVMGGQCRYEPTCSRYGIEAYTRYGPIVGTRLTVSRILRCHPFAKGGYDPVPIRDDEGSGSYDEAGHERGHTPGIKKEASSES